MFEEDTGLPLEERVENLEIVTARNTEKIEMVRSVAAMLTVPIAAVGFGPVAAVGAGVGIIAVKAFGLDKKFLR